MPVTVLVSITALFALVPASVLPYRGDGKRDSRFWLLLGVALAGSVVAVAVLFAPGWRTGLGSALWATVALSLVLFSVIAATSADGWRLAPLLLPYLILIGILATISQEAPEQPLQQGEINGWTISHIVFALLAYGFLTLSAVAAMSVFIQERALKSKRPSTLSRALPSIADGERLEVQMLLFSVLMLGFGVITGMASQFVFDGRLFDPGHKTILSIVALLVLAALLAAHYLSGLRGRRATRLVLLAYLLLTLAYPGVKFVTDVVMG